MRRPAAVLVSGLLTAVAACGSSGGGTDAHGRRDDDDAAGVKIGSPRERQLFHAVQAYNDAYYTGDARTVRRLRVSLCRELSWEEGLPSQVNKAATEYGEPQRITSFRARTAGRLAFVTYAFEDPDLRRHRGEAWSREPEGWRYADC